MRVQPIGEFVLIEKKVGDALSAGGIHIPESAQSDQDEGVVAAVGEGILLEDGTIKPLSVKVGDKVLFSEYAGTKLKYNGIDYLIMGIGGVMALLEEE